MQLDEVRVWSVARTAEEIAMQVLSFLALLVQKYEY
jgi:hypothetical protein